MSTTNTTIRRISWLATIAFLGWFAFEAFHWTVNHVYVPPGKSLLLRYKGPLLFGGGTSPQPGRLASLEKMEVGVMEEMVGPGRHFYCPLWWERTLVDDVVVEPGEIAIVTSLVGDDLVAATDQQSTDNQFLVEGELGNTTVKGMLRRVYGPGRYRVNPYAYKVDKIKTQKDASGTQTKHSGWVSIGTGHVGVVTNQTDNPKTGAKKGIQPQPLPPGLYAVNPREQQIDAIEIGYREKTIQTALKHDASGQLLLDESGEPQMADNAGGIAFPSKDGFTIHMDFTAIWGIMPEQAPRVVEFSGNVDAVEQRVVVPLIESICRNEGSKLGAVELLVGETREHFQDETTLQFETRLKETGVALQYGLVRHIYIPRDVRIPIQQRYLADELTLTRDQEQLTAKIEADLREQERTVELETERIVVETEKLVAEKQAEGKKTAAETRAETTKLVATGGDRNAGRSGRRRADADGGSESGTVQTRGGGFRNGRGVQPVGLRDRTSRRPPIADALRWGRDILDRSEGFQRDDAGSSGEPADQEGERQTGHRSAGSVTVYSMECGISIPPSVLPHNISRQAEWTPCGGGRDETTACPFRLPPGDKSGFVRSRARSKRLSTTAYCVRGSDAMALCSP
ncbi:MAG: SPFH domain-containing protein [Planctomycetota bacterium]|nr:SPFH domain-containing protein [Planctomycetota bacterium]